jgi:Arc/MetJ family transcription regulator
VAAKKAAGGKSTKGPKKAVRLNAAGKFLSLKRDKTSRRVRKNMDMDPAKLAAVKEILGAPTDTEAVDRAFDEIIFEHRVTSGLERLAETGGLPKVDPDA